MRKLFHIFLFLLAALAQPLVAYSAALPQIINPLLDPARQCEIFLCEGADFGSKADGYHYSSSTEYDADGVEYVVTVASAPNGIPTAKKEQHFDKQIEIMYRWNIASGVGEWRPYRKVTYLPYTYYEFRRGKWAMVAQVITYDIPESGTIPARWLEYYGEACTAYDAMLAEAVAPDSLSRQGYALKMADVRYAASDSVSLRMFYSDAYFYRDGKLQTDTTGMLTGDVRYALDKAQMEHVMAEANAAEEAYQQERARLAAEERARQEEAERIRLEQERKQQEAERLHQAQLQRKATALMQFKADAIQQLGNMNFVYKNWSVTFDEVTDDKAASFIITPHTKANDVLYEFATERYAYTHPLGDTTEVPFDKTRFTVERVRKDISKHIDKQYGDAITYYSKSVRGQSQEATFGAFSYLYNGWDIHVSDNANGVVSFEVYTNAPLSKKNDVAPHTLVRQLTIPAKDLSKLDVKTRIEAYIDTNLSTAETYLAKKRRLENAFVQHEGWTIYLREHGRNADYEIVPNKRTQDKFGAATDGFVQSGKMRMDFSTRNANNLTRAVERASYVVEEQLGHANDYFSGKPKTHRVSVFKKFYNRCGYNHLTFAHVSYRYGFEEYSNSLQFGLLQGRIHWVTLSLLDFETSFLPYNQTWGYCPSVRLHLPIAPCATLNLHGGLAIDITGSRANDNDRDHKWWSVFGGLGSTIYPTQWVPIELYAEYRYPFSQSPTPGFERGFYLGARVGVGCRTRIKK